VRRYEWATMAGSGRRALAFDRVVFIDETWGQNEHDAQQYLLAESMRPRKPGLAARERGQRLPAA
jgi:hypothetical protein